MTNTENNKRIAKNTGLLYIRMLLIMALSLYTSRIVLSTLGVVDYGLYNVVGGVVAMFTFISAAMGNSTQRYLAFALGKRDNENLQKVFSSSLAIHWVLAIVILVLAETLGLWFLNTKMIIPVERMSAAHWVYQFSILACMVSIISLPYNALIIAHEKMSAFTFISILDVVLKLLIVFLISNASSDKLILYAALILCVQLIDQLIYGIYCTKHFPESKFKKLDDRGLIKEMTSFAGWSLIGNLAWISYSQGLNILLNLFFGLAVNAAMGIAVQVQGAIKGFVTNFQMAVNPQIIKSFASEDYKRLHTLIFSSSKISYFLLLCFVLPLVLEADQVLSIWLKEVPIYAVPFLRLILIINLIDPLSNPVGVANNATGKIKIYQIVEGGLLLLILPISYIFLKIGSSPESVFVVQFCIFIIVHIARLFLVRKKLKMPIKDYLVNVVVPITIVTLVSVIAPFILYIKSDNTIISFILVCVISVLSVLFAVYIFGLSPVERYIVNEKASQLKVRLFHSR